MEFEFNLGEQIINSQPKRDETLYASVSGSAAQLSADELVFLEHQTNANHMMTMTVLNAISLARQFKPIHEHVQHLQQMVPELRGQQAAIEKVFGFLKKKHLLVSEEQWIESLKNTPQEAEQALPYAGIVVRTCHRPDSLKRLLDSIELYLQQHNRSDAVLVFDDSTDKHKMEQTAAVCQESSLKVQYYGEAWQQQFIEMLCQALPEHQPEIQWLLAQREGFTAGRVWNLALLSLAGKKFAFYDDDYLLQPRESADSNHETIDITGRGDLSVGFGLNVREIKDGSRTVESDVLGMSIDACGRRFGDWLENNADVGVGTLKYEELPELQRQDTHTRIKTVGHGTWGSPRASSNYWLYFLTGKQREAFWKDRDIYLDNIEASHLLHYSDNLEALHYNRFSPAVIDNSSVSAFAMPTDVNEDHFFGCLMLGCYPNQVSLHYPYMMGHIQDQMRNRSSMNHVALQANLNRFLGDYFLSVSGRFDSVDPATRMQILASCLDDLGSSSDQLIENRLREYRNQLSADLVHSLQQQLLEVPDAPIYWQADVREIIETNASYIRSSDSPYLSGWDQSQGLSSSIQDLRTELDTVSKAMKVWPKLWSFCLAQ
ncbi:glycosyltransferase family A protein [Marinicella sp. W31]|uniref:glycosyltransferase family A protein n=1 Tax=Marinicella sp. W31 TaxID=3023713 RepID=UPI0037584BD9